MQYTNKSNISYSTSKMLEFNKRICSNIQNVCCKPFIVQQSSFSSIHIVCSLRNGCISKKKRSKYQPFQVARKSLSQKKKKEAKHVWIATGIYTYIHTHGTAFLPQKCGQLFSQRENAEKSQIDWFIF